MLGGAHDSPPVDPGPSGEDRLDSWKEIAEYLKRSVRTVRRWEAQESLPVRRHVHQNGGTVYAFKRELDAWLARRTPLPSSSSEGQSPNGQSESFALPALSSFQITRRRIVMAGTLLIAALLLLVGIGQVRRRADLKRVDPEASRLLLESSVAASRRTPDGFREAIAYCQEAIEKQPNFAAAYSLMARYYQQFAFTGGVRPLEFMPQAERAALKAIELDDTLAEAHAQLAAVLYRFKWDWSASEREFRRALALNSNYADGYRMFSVFLSATGRHEDAIINAQHGRDLDPRSLNTALNLGLAYLAAGQNDLAIEELRGAVAKARNQAQGHHALGNALLAKQMLAESIDELQTAVNRSNGTNPAFLSSLAFAYTRSGQTTEARTTLRELETLAAHQYVQPSAIALIYFGLEDTQTARVWLERAIRERDTDLVLPSETGMVKLRSDPAFRDVFSRMGLVR
jgi:tetratricopeptide (TPR) repeat protein